jgi:hypothetical protein
VLRAVSAEPAYLDLGVPVVFPDAAMGAAWVQVGQGLGQPDGVARCPLDGGAAGPGHVGGRRHGADGHLCHLRGGPRGQLAANGDDLAGQAAGRPGQAHERRRGRDGRLRGGKRGARGREGGARHAEREPGRCPGRAAGLGRHAAHDRAGEAHDASGRPDHSTQYHVPLLPAGEPPICTPPRLGHSVFREVHARARSSARATAGSRPSPGGSSILAGWVDAGSATHRRARATAARRVSSPPPRGIHQRRPLEKG